MPDPAPSAVTPETRVSLKLALSLVALVGSIIGTGLVVLNRLDTMEVGLGRQVTATEKLADAVRAGEAERARLSGAIDRLSDQLARNEDRASNSVSVQHFFLWVERARMAYPELPGYTPR